MKRLAVRSLLAVAALCLSLAAAAATALWLTLPDRTAEVSVPGLAAPLDIAFDADGIPRIRAASALDAATALGFVHARDRMFQMELMRRAAAGRLSEIAGAATVPMDRMMRTLGLGRAAADDFEALEPGTRALLQAYARGVNAWIDHRGRFAAPEFLPLGAPEAWQPADSLLWAKTMGLWLSMNWRQELARLGLQGRLPASQIDQLWPAPAPAPPPDARRNVPQRFADAAARLHAALPAFPDPFAQPQSASNEWAVDGRSTATGAPLLAGDPHLALGFPGIWYLARIDTPEGTLAGATAPGVPFLVLGHNGRIAWTFTTTGADTQDVFIEAPAEDGQYATPEGPRPFLVRREVIKVRGGPDEVLTVRETRHGPVVSDLDNPGGPVLAVAMANLQPGDTAAAGLLALNRAATVRQAGAAAALIASPVQNLLVADARTIGLFVTGRVPVRRGGDGSAPVPGDGSRDWTGWASGAQLPHIVSPASGRLVNANEPVWGAGFPVFMGGDTFGDWRAQRIRQMLAATERHTAAGFAAMQLDAVDGFARAVLPVLLSVPGIDPAARTILAGWDGTAAMDSAAPLVFNAWMRAFEAATHARAGTSRGPGAPASDFLSHVLSPAGAHWCGGDCAGMLRDSLGSAMRGLSARFGENPATWTWGNAHRAVFAHPILRYVPVIGSLTTISVPSAGDDSTVGRGGTNGSFESVHAAAYRGVYDLSDLDRSLFIAAPGQSGNPLSAHAGDLALRWRDGGTVALGPLVAAPSATVRLAQ